MKNWLKKFSAITSATVMAAVSVSATVPILATDSEFSYTIEGEDLDGATLWTSIYSTELPGYSGEGFAYLTGGALTFTVDAPEDGMYQLTVRGVQILDAGGRYQTVSINGREYSKTVPYYDTWTDIDFGVVRLNEGENEISFLNKYGYLAIDYVTVEKAVFPDVTQADSDPCDSEATDETKALMSYLSSVYGEHIISGQQEIYGGGHDGDYEQEFEYIYDMTGEYPAIRGFDFMNYNPLYGWDDGTTERIIDWVNNRNGIATACWHINIPTDFENYTPGEAVDWTECTYKPNSQFSVVNAVIEGTKENEYLNLAIEDLAEQFAILQDAGVPILWRPFHEAEGNPSSTSDPIDGSGSWFWWAQDGAEAYKNLWVYLYDQLTNVYGIHNLIWQQNLYAWSEASGEWYSGDDYVDIIGYDKYDTMYNRNDGLTSGPNESCNSDIYWSILGYTDYSKMAAIMENSTIPNIDNIQTEQAYWLYFCTWYDNGSENFISGSEYNNLDSVITMYQSDLCITLGELPSDLYSYSETSSNTQATTSDDQIEPLLGDANGDKEVNIADATRILQSLADKDNYCLEGQALLNADCHNPTTPPTIDANDALAIQQVEAGVYDISDLPIVE